MLHSDDWKTISLVTVIMTFNIWSKILGFMQVSTLNFMKAHVGIFTFSLQKRKAFFTSIYIELHVLNISSSMPSFSLIKAFPFLLGNVHKQCCCYCSCWQLVFKKSFLSTPNDIGQYQYPNHIFISTIFIFGKNSWNKACYYFYVSYYVSRWL